MTLIEEGQLLLAALRDLEAPISCCSLESKPGNIRMWQLFRYQSLSGRDWSDMELLRRWEHTMADRL